MMATRSRKLDILIVGAGQAGLALGYHLKTTSFRFQLVNCHSRIGDSWRKRYDSLVLFTPRAYSTLPGLSVPGDPEGYPTKDEIADYLETYAAHFALPVLGDTHISLIERTDEGFRATTGTGETIDCRAVVLATGAYQMPALPDSAQQLSADVLQLSPTTYTSPAQIPGGPVGWVATREASIGELGLTFRLPLGNRYLWDFATLPGFQGRGIYPRLLQAILEQESLDAERFWIIHAPENLPSGAGMHKAGLFPIGQLSFRIDGGVGLAPLGSP